MPRVPVADGTRNQYEHHVTGSKSDTAVSTATATTSIVALLKGAVGMLLPTEATGTADIDVTAADYTSYQTLLTIAPATSEPIVDSWLHLDFNKTTTGLHATGSVADTFDAEVMFKTDGTNLRHGQSFTQVTVSNTPADTACGQRLHIGPIGATETCVIKCKLSAERTDTEIPYRFVYRANAAPTITPVAAA